MEPQKNTIGDWMGKNWHFLVFFFGMFVTWGTVTEKVNSLVGQVETINTQIYSLTASVAKLEGKVDFFIQNGN